MVVGVYICCVSCFHPFALVCGMLCFYLHLSTSLLDVQTPKMEARVGERIQEQWTALP